MCKVLWLPSWYPGKVDAFNGDFIERHAIAVSPFVKLTIIAIVKDPALNVGQFVIEKSVEKNYVVYRGYYGKSSNNKLLEKLFSFKKYFSLQKKIYNQIVAQQGLPNIVHVHVAIKAGMFALYLKHKFGIPYVVTEHWGGYFYESTPNVYSGNWVLNTINKKVLLQCNLLFPVTDNLGKTINANFVTVGYKVIPNVVDTDLFFYKNCQPKKFTFIHVSQLNFNKNPDGILQACNIVKNKGYDFELIMVGDLNDDIINVAKQLQLYNTTVFFKSVMPYLQVATQMQQSSAFILFSRSENLPCVILEALCCGLPIISSNVGGIKEWINDTNGILVESENIQQLATAMCNVIDKYKNYNRQMISKFSISKFNFNTVGKQYFTEYQNLLKPSV